MATSLRSSGKRKGYHAFDGIPGEETVFMKFFRPDQDQVSTFRVQKMNKCRICFRECGTQRIVAQTGCCNCLVHLDCFNDLAARPSSASTFTCPKCNRELSSESVQAARRRTCRATANENEEEEDSEMMLGSVATKNITARGTAYRRQSCRDRAAGRRRQDVSKSSSKSLESRDSPGDASLLFQAVSGEVGQFRRAHGRSDSPTLTFFTPYHELKKKLAAERNKNSRSGNFLSWLLTMITGWSPKQDTPQEQSQDYV
jgi:hypothetical protein